MLDDENEMEHLKWAPASAPIEIPSPASSRSPLPSMISEDPFRSVADCTYDWESWLDPSGS